MTKHTMTGAFIATDLGSGAWQVKAATPAGIEVYLQGADNDAAAVLKDRHLTRLGVEWRVEGVVVSVTGASGFRYFKSRAAVIHEPQPRLYASLPLAVYNAAARRFWRRIFWLIRIPGGRLMLAYIAKRRRGVAPVP